MKHFISLLLLLSFSMTSSATEARNVPDRDRVYQWGSETLTLAVSQTDAIAPTFFELAIMPTDFDFSNLVYDREAPNSLTEVSKNNAILLRDVGIVSALAEYCELPWQEKNFLPMMQWQRALVPPNERQGLLIAKIGVSHGHAMGITGQLLKVWQPNCKRLEADLDGQFFADRFP